VLFYFIIFTVVGFFIGSMNQNNEKQALVIIIIIAVLWTIGHAPIWGLASLGEMVIGYFIFKMSQ